MDEENEICLGPKDGALILREGGGMEILLSRTGDRVVDPDGHYSVGFMIGMLVFLLTHESMEDALDSAINGALLDMEKFRMEEGTGPSKLPN